MICPTCKIDRLVEDEDNFLNCLKCGLHRRPGDKVLVCKKTNFHILNRNVARSPRGIEVEIVETNPGLRGIYGQLKTEKSTHALRSSQGFIIGLSRDKDDLILLIAEHGWCIKDPEIANIVNGIENDNSTGDTSGCG